jgi:hypothetical protein
MCQKIKFVGNAVIDHPPEKDATEYVKVLNVCGHHFVIVAVMIFGLGWKTVQADGQHASQHN